MRLENSPDYGGGHQLEAVLQATRRIPWEACKRPERLSGENPKGLSYSPRRHGSGGFSVPNLTLYAFATKRQTPRNFGTVIKVPRLKHRTGVVRAVSAGSEGNLIIGQNLASCAAVSEFASGTFKQFAGFYRHSDVIVMTALSDVVNLSLKSLARDLALQMDTFIGDQISGSGTRIMGNGAAATTSATNGGTTAFAMRSVSLLKAATILDANNNPRPAGGYYPAVIHPFQQFDLQSQLTGNAWIEIN